MFLSWSSFRKHRWVSRLLLQLIFISFKFRLYVFSQIGRKHMNKNNSCNDLGMCNPNEKKTKQRVASTRSPLGPMHHNKMRLNARILVSTRNIRALNARTSWKRVVEFSNRRRNKRRYIETNSKINEAITHNSTQIWNCWIFDGYRMLCKIIIDKGCTMLIQVCLYELQNSTRRFIWK